MNSLKTCDVKGGYAGQECVLEPDHPGEHQDFLDRTWDEAGVAKPVPVIDPDKITANIARKIAEDHPGDFEDDGTTTIEGVEVDWWMDEERIWFFNPGDTGEDTIKRFGLSRSVDVWDEE